MTRRPKLLSSVIILLQQYGVIPKTMFKRQYDGTTRHIHLQQQGRHQERYPNNYVSNTKYTPFTFLPHNMLEQFRSHMNRYFFLIACLQLWPSAAPVSPVTIWTPLIIAMLLTATKAAYDDIRRWKSDKKLNERRVQRLDGSYCASKDIRVGDIICVREDEEFPCDMLLLASSGPHGHAFMMTANIDGETDLKHRHVARPIYDIMASNTVVGGRSGSGSSSGGGIDIAEEDEVDDGQRESNVRDSITRWLEQNDNNIGVMCPHPNASFDAFNAKLIQQQHVNPTEVSLSYENLLLQCCHLKKTAWVFGAAMYTGNETKCGENKGYPKMKKAHADKLIDNIALTIFVCQLTIMTVFGVFSLIYRNSEMHTGIWYLNHPEIMRWTEWVVLPLRFLLLTSYMVPISLKVQMDFTKLIYAIFIDNDHHMYDAESDTPASTQNSSISEDLGRVEYVLTDKTGTLTVNSMSFESCSIGGRLFGRDKGSNSSVFEDAGLQSSLRQKDEDILQFLRAISLCHMCVVDKDKHGNIRYNSSSPDEEALVKAASRLDVTLTSTDADIMTLDIQSQNIETYEMLQCLKFSSERKRMSVVLRQRESNRIWIVSKGADDVMLHRLSAGQDALCETTEHHLTSFGQSGLRTLVVAWRELSLEEYKAWNEQYERANVSMGDRQQELSNVYQLLEQDLTLLGATAIEDKLQDHVPETIRMIRRAEIGVWMLTGDKFETAKQIAISCGLLGNISQENNEEDEQLIEISGTGGEHLRDTITQAMEWTRAFQSIDALVHHQNYSLIVTGEALEQILSSSKLLFDETYSLVAPELCGLAESFTELARNARSVVCCRVTPHQKASIVSIVKSLGKITLAIGDGGNDVPMIQEAHIGVGIAGKEGLEAARASDFSFAQFRFLIPLIFAHGHYSYIRTSIIAQFSFYKNIMLAFMQVLFNMWAHFSGLSPYNDMSLALYNILWASVYTLTAVFDRDVDYDELVRRPKLYRYTRQGTSLGLKSAVQWLLYGFMNAIAIMCLTIYGYRGKNPSIDTEYFGNLIYTIAIWVDVLIFALFTKSFNVVNIMAMVGTLVSYFAFMLIYNWILPLRLLVGRIFQLPAVFRVFGVWNQILIDPLFYLTLILCVVVCLTPPLVIRYLKQQISPSIIERYLHAKKRFGPNSTIANFISDFVPFDKNETSYGAVEKADTHTQSHHHIDEYSAESTDAMEYIASLGSNRHGSRSPAEERPLLMK